jgi:hypothetical protein
VEQVGRFSLCAVFIQIHKYDLSANTAHYQGVRGG